jgi:alpha-glucosidase
MTQRMEKERNKTGSRNPKAISQSNSNLLLIFFLLVHWVPLISGKEVKEEVVGYGYKVGSVNSGFTGKSLTADLSLIKESSVYGDDIQHLSLVAR